MTRDEEESSEEDLVHARMRDYYNLAKARMIARWLAQSLV